MRTLCHSLPVAGKTEELQLDTIHPFIASLNIAPSLPIPAIRTIDQQRILTPLIWGLIPKRN